MDKKQFSNHLLDRWYFYVLWTIVVLIISIWSISFASKPTKKEKITIFLTAYSYDKELYEYLNNVKESYLKKVEIINYSPDEEYYNTFYLSYEGITDVMIVKGEYLDKVNYNEYISFSLEEMEELFGNEYDYLIKNDNYYGIKIHSKNTDKGLFSNYISYSKMDNENILVDDDYYLLVSKRTVHLGKLNNNELSGLVDLIRKMIAYEN